jgi:dTDP-4-dehydrorhamnose 3,5-epimerase
MARAGPREITLPAGVRVRVLEPKRDERGELTELFRDEWGTATRPVQWNAISSAAGVLRGVHVHPRHDDYLILLRGWASIGLRDLRPGSPTSGATATVEQRGDAPVALEIPHGVAHGFYFHKSSLHVYSVSENWDVDDELACRWDDPGLGLDWGIEAPLLSERDALAGSLAEMVDVLRARLRS